MSATRRQPSRVNKGGGSSGVRTSPGERSEGRGRAHAQRKGNGPEGAANSPQASVIQREGGQTQTQGQRARRRPSRSSQQIPSNFNTAKSKSSAPPSSSAPTLPPPASSVTTATATSTNNPLPSSTTPSTTTVKRTLDVAPPTVGPKGIMHDKMVHVSFQPVPETPTSAPPSTRTTRAQKREERQLQQRNSQPMDDNESDSDSSSPRVKGLFDHPLLPPKKARKKPKHTTASTRNTSDTAPISVSNTMDLDLQPTIAQHHPPTPLSAQPLPSPSQGAASSYWTQPWSGYGHGNTNATTSSADPTRSTPNPPTPHAAPNTPFTSFAPQAQGWPHVGGINVTPIGWTNPANAPESFSLAAPPNGSFPQFSRVSQPSPSLHDTSPTLVHQSTPHLQNQPQLQPNSDGFVDPGPWYPWKADTTWYEPHPTNPYYRLHEKWFPGAPTLATHPDGQNGGIIYDDGKTYPPSMFVEGRPDLEYFGLGVDPPETIYDFVGTVATARQFHFDDSRAGFDQNAKDELGKVGRPLPFITVFEDEMVALVEEFLWRRRRARRLGKPIPNLDPPPERYRHSSSPTAAPRPVNWGLSSAMSAWNTEAEPGGEGGEQGYAEGGGRANSAPVPGQTPQSHHPSGQPMDYDYPAQGSTQPKPHQQQFQTSPSQHNQAQRVEGVGLTQLNQPTQSPPPGQPPWAVAMAHVLQSSKSSDGTLATAWNPPQANGSVPWNPSNNGYPGVNYSGSGGNGLGVAAGGHGPSPGSAAPITAQGWPPHANVGVNSGPPIGRGGAAAGPKISPPAIYGDSGRPAGGPSVPFGTDITETEDYPGGAVYAELAGQQLQRQQAQQHQPQHQHQQSRQGSGSNVPPPNQLQRPPPQRVGSGPQYLPTTPGLHPPQNGGQNANSPYQPPFENSWLDPVIAQQQAATNQQPAPPEQQRSPSQPTSPPFVAPNFARLNLPPTPNLNGPYMVNVMHHPQFAAAVPGAPGAHPSQFYPADQAFGGQFGVAQQSFAHQ